jgi:sugar/nucleoside kinase (ribokinase family)
LHLDYIGCYQKLFPDRQKGCQLMNSVLEYDLVCIGNYTKDTIISPSGTKYVDGGAVNYAAHASAQLGLRTAVVTHLAEEDKRVVEKFISDGIDCYQTYTPFSTTMRLEYPTNNPDIRTLSVASTAEPISPEEIKDISTKSAVIGSSFRGEVGSDVIRALKGKNVFLGADMQGFVRVLRGQSLNFEPWDEMPEILPYIDVVKSDAVEAQHLTGEADIYEAANKFAWLGAKEIVLTHKDGVLVYAEGKFHQAKFYAKALDGRSGRGDTCLGAYMAMRRIVGPFEAILWAAAVTSLKMEKLGPFDRPMMEIKRLLRVKYDYDPRELSTSLGL